MAIQAACGELCLYPLAPTSIDWSWLRLTGRSGLFEHGSSGVPRLSMLLFRLSPSPVFMLRYYFFSHTNSLAGEEGGVVQSQVLVSLPNEHFRVFSD